MESNLIKRAKYKYEEDGLKSFVIASLRHVYKLYIRNYIPKRDYLIKQNIKIYDPDYRFLDEYIMGSDFIIPDNHKQSNVLLVRKQINDGDDVITVGGGRGITSINAALEVGPSGSVTIYEPSKSQINELKQNSILNEVDNIITTRHAFVGEVIIDVDDVETARGISPEDLPECDVLELDCEGAEKEILEGLKTRPNTIIVETHPRQGTATEKISRILKQSGYSIIDKEKDRHCGDILVGSLES